MTAPELVKALSAAQADFAGIDKTSENRHFGSKYADLAAVLNAVRPTLAKHGLAIVQVVVEHEHGTSLETKLLHESGELVSSMPLPMDGLTSQQVGSAMTYARRYAALAICGVHPEDDDDDGNAATEAGPQRARRRTSSEPKLASEAQQKFAQRLLDETVHHTMHLAVTEEHAGRAVPVTELLSHEASQLIEWLKEEKKAGRTPDGDIESDAADDSEPF